MHHETSQARNGRVGAMIALEAVAIALLLATGLLGDGNTYQPAFVMLVLFTLCWPFRTGRAERVIGLVAGICSLTFACTGAADAFLPQSRVDAAIGADLIPLVQWAGCFAGLLVLLTIVSFARQMLREERSHLIRALSHCLTGGTASVALAGWCFLPEAVEAGATAPMPLSAVVVAIAVLLVLALCAASVWWLRELDPTPEAREPWIGVALLPVMLSGIVVFASAIALTLL